MPVNPQTAKQLAQRNRLATMSSQWAGLTDLQRNSWNDFALQNPVADKLRQSQILSGQQTFVKVNSRLLQSGDATLTDAPIGTAPDAMTGVTATFDIGLGTTELSFTNTPLGANIKLWMTASVTNSQGIAFVKNLQRVITISAAALTSPYDYQADIEAVFGTLQVGQKVVLFPSTFDTATGLKSGQQRVEGIVVST